MSDTKHASGFDKLPEKLVTDRLTIRCLSKENGLDVCPGWVTNVEIDPDDIRMDGYGLLHFPDHVPTECPECHDRMLAYNGVEVTFHV